ncbi:hypothetical protein A3762_15270 [Oleiphilus sp. HI0125]|nr:hypothetical protein A3762_15270 [Oleiphilus sp. HI0125]
MLTICINPFDERSVLSQGVATEELKSELSVQAVTYRALFLRLIDNGYSESLLQSRYGLSLSYLDAEENRVPLDRYYALWRDAVSYTKEPDLALQLAAEELSQSMGLVGHVFFNCKTLRSAIEHYQRYYRIVNESIQIELQSNDQDFAICYHVKEPAIYSSYEMEYSLALAAYRARRLLQSGLDIRYVSFPHSKPAYAASYETLFQCPVKFDQPVASIVFNAAYLDYPMPRNSPTLYRVLTVHLDRILASLKANLSIKEQVRQIVAKKLSDPNLDAGTVARRLNMSRNTLYRRLKKEGVSYHEIVDEVRSEFAIRSIKEDKYSFTELAFLLGFSEVSAFSRAFKRWTGSTPNKYGK